MEGALAAHAAPASCTPPLRGGSPASRRGDARASEYLSRRRRQPAASLRPPRSVSCDFAVSVLAVRPSFALFSVIPSGLSLSSRAVFLCHPEPFVPSCHPERSEGSALFRSTALCRSGQAPRRICSRRSEWCPPASLSDKSMRPEQILRRFAPQNDKKGVCRPVGLSKQ